MLAKKNPILPKWPTDIAQMLEIDPLKIFKKVANAFPNAHVQGTRRITFADQELPSPDQPHQPAEEHRDHRTQPISELEEPSPQSPEAYDPEDAIEETPESPDEDERPLTPGQDIDEETVDVVGDSERPQEESESTPLQTELFLENLRTHIRQNEVCVHSCSALIHVIISDTNLHG